MYPRSPRPRKLFSVAATFTGVFLLAYMAISAGCTATPRSTRLQLGDIDEAVERMIASLTVSDFLAARGPDSPPMVIVINRVSNLTTDLIPPEEQWMVMARLRGALPIRQFADRKNIRFQITPERHAMLREHGFRDELGGFDPPTHVMAAVFRSARREVRDPRDGQIRTLQDYYYMEFTIDEIITRKTEWTDRFEFKRMAVGSRID